MTLKVLKTATGLLVATMLGCLAAAGWFDGQKYARSGIPSGHYAVVENGRQFYVPRGGPPVDQRPHVALTDEQYQHWDENNQASNLWGSRGVLCLFAIVGLAIWARLAGPGCRTTAEASLPHPPNRVS
jgi:hypothetical protein